jgi:hypothetical protein
MVEYTFTLDHRMFGRYGKPMWNPLLNSIRLMLYHICTELGLEKPVYTMPKKRTVGERVRFNIKLNDERPDVLGYFEVHEKYVICSFAVEDLQMVLDIPKEKRKKLLADMTKILA